MKVTKTKATKRRKEAQKGNSPLRPSAPLCGQQKASWLVGALLDWFATAARDLPWRRTTAPYAVWVSEIMLQQTQVKTVWPFWERWMRELPTVAALAAARPERVLKLWEGLGYYTRARNLQRAAQLIVARPGGEFPTQFDEMLALPGVGRYTAGAIGSIAFNQPAPILDGNVMRVLTRLFALTGNPREKETNARLWQLAEQLVRAAAAVDFKSQISNLKFPLAGPCSALNQALMELGALVCTPRSPQCPRCPLAARCVARRQGLAAQLPNLAPRAATTARRFLAFVAQHGDHFLVRQRPAGLINAHLWEFPGVEIEALAVNPVEQFCQQFNITPRRWTPLGVIKHAITRYRMSVEAFHAALPRRPAAPAGHWRTRGELDALAFTSAHRKILGKLPPPRTLPGA